MSETIDYSQFPTKPAPCCVCGSEEHTVFCTKDGMDYVKCAVCGHVYMRDQVSEEDLLKIYSSRTSHHNQEQKLAWDFSEMKAEVYYYKLLKRMEKVIEPGPLLDIGCSNGSFAKAALDKGWDALGLELEESSVLTAREQGVEVIHGELFAQKFEDNRFHAVTMWNLFEHLFDPVAALTEVYRILKPGGVCAMCVPNIRNVGWWMLKADWHSVEPQIHQNLFSVNTLTRLATDKGFTVRHMAAVDIKPATVKAWLRKGKKKDDKRHAASVASMAQQSPAKMAMLFRIRALTNIPLILTRSGEDIFATLQKPKATS